jgi:hypothetical protein
MKELSPFQPELMMGFRSALYTVQYIKARPSEESICVIKREPYIFASRPRLCHQRKAPITSF